MWYEYSGFLKKKKKHKCYNIFQYYFTYLYPIKKVYVSEEIKCEINMLSFLGSVLRISDDCWNKGLRVGSQTKNIGNLYVNIDVFLEILERIE